MRVIVCSDYLARQQAHAEHAADEARWQPIARPSGRWSWLRWWVVGGMVRAWFARIHVARRHQVVAFRYAQGRGGEELLARVLARQLDDRYTLLRNYTPPLSHHGDVDAVLVGPHGITSFEVKTWRGYFRVTGTQWLYRADPRSGWRPAEKNPTLQALDNAQRLRAVLARAALEHIPLRPVVAIASARMYVEVIPPLAVHLFFATQPQRQLEASLGPAALDADRVRRVVATLLG